MISAISRSAEEGIYARRRPQRPVHGVGGCRSSAAVRRARSHLHPTSWLGVSTARHHSVGSRFPVGGLSCQGQLPGLFLRQDNEISGSRL